MAYKLSNAAKIFKSNIAGDIPTTPNLELDNLYLNTADAVLYGVVLNQTTRLPELKEMIRGTKSKKLSFLLTEVDTEGVLTVETTTLENQVGPVKWTRRGVGVFPCNSDGLFVEGKTVPIDDIWSDATGNIFTLTWVSEDEMVLAVTDALGDPADIEFVNRAVFIEIFD